MKKCKDDLKEQVNLLVMGACEKVVENGEHYTFSQKRSACWQLNQTSLIYGMNAILLILSKEREK